MKRLVVESWLLLIYFDCLMLLRSFDRLSVVMRKCRVRTDAKGEYRDSELCHAIRLACVFYFKRVLCLQRSAATTVLLRRHGLKAEMVIGAQLLPYQSHAWVEVNGHVINDKPYVTEMFQVLQRC